MGSDNRTFCEWGEFLMPTNYLTTDTDLTSVANAIRTKGGTSAQLAFPADFITAIGNISGGESFVDDLANVSLVRFTKPTGVSEIVVDLTKIPNLSNYEQMFLNPRYTKITVTPLTSAKSTLRMFYLTSGISSLQEIHINGTLKIASNSGSNTGTFGFSNTLKKITGYLDLSSQTRGQFFSATGGENGFKSCSALEEIHFVPGSMLLTTTNWYLADNAALNDDTLVSIANSLLDTYSGTITFHSTPKARLANIMGTVATADGLSTFTIDAGGTVSLQNFITTTKGATLA